MELPIDAALLDGMKYAELQKIAKKLGVKANMKVSWNNIKNYMIVIHIWSSSFSNQFQHVHHFMLRIVVGIELEWMGILCSIQELKEIGQAYLLFAVTDHGEDDVGQMNGMK